MTALTLLAHYLLILAAAPVCSIPLLEWAERRFGMERES